MSSRNKISISIRDSNGECLVNFPSAELMFRAMMATSGNFFGLDLNHLLNQGPIGFRVGIGETSYGVEQLFEETIYKDPPVAEYSYTPGEIEDILAENERLRAYASTTSIVQEANKLVNEIAELKERNEKQKRALEVLLNDEGN